MATVRQAVEIVAKDPGDLPGKQVACRVHHPWPSENMVDTRVLPPGLYATPAGVCCPHGRHEPNMWHLNDVCPRCGNIRYQDMPNGVYVNGPWKRKYDKDWVRWAGVDKFTSRAALAENMRRNMGKFDKFFNAPAEQGEP